MKKIPLQLAQGVSNIELFYDLIFVYCISVITGVLHHPEGGFFNFQTYARYAIYMLTILQVWFFTTYLQNRYGDGKAFDNTCLFINMFLLYFMVGCIGQDGQSGLLTWNIVWGLILIDLLVHWGIKRFRYSNLDEEDIFVMSRTMKVLAVQAIIVFVAAFLPWQVGQWVSLAGFAFGWLAFSHGRKLTNKPTRFDHLAERCSLLVIVTFGETIVTIASYMETHNLAFAVLVFLLVVGLFLVYFFENDYMLDHHHKSNGISYMLLTSWIVFAIANVTVALEYLPDQEISLVPKTVYLTGMLCAYLLTSFAVFRFNKPQFRAGRTLVTSRIVACVMIFVVGAFMPTNPLYTFVGVTLVVWAELCHEWMLYRNRSALAQRVKELGVNKDRAISELNNLLGTHEGRRKLAQLEMRVLHESTDKDEQEPTDNRAG